jgi:hypothetical protein
MSPTTKPFNHIFDFLISNGHNGSGIDPKNQQVEIFNFAKVMARKVQNFRSFFGKVAVV